MSYPYEFDGFPNPFINKKRERNDDQYESNNNNEIIEKTKKNNINLNIYKENENKIKFSRPLDDDNSQPNNTKRTKF